DGHQSTIPEDIDMIIDNSLVTLGGEPARVGINPITVDHEGKWLYYGPMSATSLYRVPTAALRDPSLAPEDLANQVERYGDKPISDGSTIDAAGNVYITSVTDASIGVTAADGSYRTLYQSDSLPWPDGFSTGPGGHIYATINALHRSTSLSDGKLDDRSHFRIVKFPALSPVVVGR
ncbi:MAG: L-dopachrome tautomerase-related protein, partial [Verrucomicrobiota bacterium]